MEPPPITQYHTERIRATGFVVARPIPRKNSTGVDDPSEALAIDAFGGQNLAAILQSPPDWMHDANIERMMECDDLAFCWSFQNSIATNDPIPIQ